MYTDIYLRADTELALKEAIPFAVHQAGIVDGPEEGDWKLSEPRLYVLDLIGPCIVEPAVYDEDGETVVTPAVIDEGFHANLRLIGSYSPDIPAEVIINPSTPNRVFA